MRAILSLTLTLTLTLLFVGGLRSQSTEAIVASWDSIAKRTQLLRVDLGTGKVTPLGRFSQDGSPPLTLGVDPINGDVVLALRLVVGSRLLRIHISDTKVLGVRVLGDILSPVTGLVFYSDSIHVIASGANGGLYRLARSGSQPKLVVALARAAAMSAAQPWQQTTWIAESGSVLPAADPAIRLVDAVTGQTVSGPHVFKGHKPVTLTGIADLPTALFRQLLTDDTGQLLLSVMFANPAVLKVTPKLVPGATRCLRMRSQFEALVLGGARHPYIYSTQAMSSNMVWKRLAGPLPGDPVAFDLVRQVAPVVISFGSPCDPRSSKGPWLGWSGVPKLGTTTFSLQVTGTAAQAPLIFVLGASDRRHGPLSLPWRLPGGCQLHCSLDIVFGLVSNAVGHALVSIPIPNNKALLDAPIFTQWIEVQTSPKFGLATSAAAAIHIGQ